MAAKSFRRRKTVGTLSENELLNLFWENLWVCVRVAGSGSTRHPAPDLLASRGDRKLVLEIKTISANKKYFSSKEIQELDFFAGQFGAEGWVGIKFSQNQWYFLPISELVATKSDNFVCDIVDMKKRGFTFEEMINLV
ncbi:MAG: Holliday junction resolvase [Nanoarchaeota archaeon]|nr:Holliday junction resolvase [Nanoarchaeota archaeon]